MERQGLTLTDGSVFSKPFTQQEGLSEAAIEHASEILRGGRLHRYNTLADETAEAALLEHEYAEFQGARYCVAVTSGGQAMQIALRAAGLKPGEPILANAYTLAPVPGAIHAVGGKPVFIEIDGEWHTDVDDLRKKAEATGAKFMLLSHMRGHIADMEAICGICDEFGIVLIEDCAHTMGASWKGKMSGNFGKVGCFSTQTYKHMNSGEGGLLTTDDEEIAARAIIMSGSYMLYQRHGMTPDEEVFQKVRLDTPNLSARMDNLRASLLRAQLPELNTNIQRWNDRYQTLETGLRNSENLYLPQRVQHEAYVGSSIQFQVTGFASEKVPQLLESCGGRGVEIKWFGAAEPIGFTSRYDSWRYFDEISDLPTTKDVLAKTCDLRVPLTFDLADCRLIARIICEEVDRLATD